MILLSISLSVRPSPVQGSILFDDGDHPEPRVIEVHPADAPPGYRLRPSDAQADWGGHDPFLCEADRIWAS